MLSSHHFTSSGTVILDYGKDGKVAKVFFTPAPHHTIAHHGNEYAVFVSGENPSSRDPATPDAKALPLDAKALPLKDKQVPLEVGAECGVPMWQALVQAAVKSVGVDVAVEIKDKSKPSFKSATVPARPHKR